MGLRPVPALWFEVVTLRDGVSQLVEALAHQGATELEAQAAPEPATPDLRIALDRFAVLARRYAAYWPEERMGGTSGPPGVVVDRALERLESWAIRADPILARLEAIGADLQNLRLLEEVLSAADGDFPEIAALRSAGPVLAGRIYALPLGAEPPPELQRIAHRIDGTEHTFVAAVGPAPDAPRIDAAVIDRGGRVLSLGAVGAEAADLRRVRARHEEATGLSAAVRGELQALCIETGIGEAVADLRRLDWFIRCVPAPLSTRNLAIVSGWTAHVDGHGVHEAIAASAVPAIVHFPPPPSDRPPPMVLSNPEWIRPFEVFTRLVGMPSTDELDPSPLLAIVAPLLFGFMFGDVGQGAVLLLAGLLLWRRQPALRLMVGGGLASIGFGLLYGSVFTREDAIPALWLHPLSEPLTLLAVSVAGGAALLMLGVVLDGIGAVTRGAVWPWLRTEGAVGVAYAALLSTALGAPLTAAVGVAVGCAVLSAGGAAVAEPGGRLVAAAGAAAHMAERLFQVCLNTLSFARVGAFALAHAGVSQAVTLLADELSSPVGIALVLVVGNVFILGLEGLVVSIQTTRLVLFEFFVRFLKAEGRPFRPLLPPQQAHRIKGVAPS